MECEIYSTRKVQKYCESAHTCRWDIEVISCWGTDVDLTLIPWFTPVLQLLLQYLLHRSTIAHYHSIISLKIIMTPWPTGGNPVSLLWSNVNLIMIKLQTHYDQTSTSLWSNVNLIMIKRQIHYDQTSN